MNLTKRLTEGAAICGLRLTIGDDAMLDLADEMDTEDVLDVAARHPHQMAGVWNSQFDYPEGVER